jgi:DNA-binding protein HU-beta
MNKHELIAAVSDPSVLDNKHNAEYAVNFIFAKIGEVLARGEDVKIAGFGTFKRVATAARTCRNPHTGETIEVPAGHKIKFKASSKLKE